VLHYINRGKFMKLAEALIIRSDLQRRISELETRLSRSATVQEGEQPPENPEELLQELEKNTKELTEIIQKIYNTNATTVIDGVGTITDALAKREVLMLKRNIIYSFLKEASVKQNRYSGSEIKILSTVEISKVQKYIDDIAAQYRLLDTKIQEKNWLVDIN